MSRFAVLNHLTHHKEDLKSIKTMDDLQKAVRNIYGNGPKQQVIYEQWINWPKLFAEVKGETV